jgi:hypothetical protein
MVARGSVFEDKQRASNGVSLLATTYRGQRVFVTTDQIGRMPWKPSSPCTALTCCIDAGDGSRMLIAFAAALIVFQYRAV